MELDFNLEPLTKEKTKSDLIHTRILIPYTDKASGEHFGYYRQIVDVIELIKSKDHTTAAVVVKERWASGNVLYVVVDYVTGRSITKENVTVAAVIDSYHTLQRQTPMFYDKILTYSKKHCDKLGKCRNSSKILEAILNDEQRSTR